MIKKIMLENGSMNEAYHIFDEVKHSINDFKKESVGIRGNLRNKREGWSVIKVYY